MKWYIIINPTSKGGKAKLLWESIKAELINQGLEFEFVFSQKPFEIIEITKQAILNGFRKMIVVGGDGSMHEAVNGIFLQNEVSSKEVLLANIPLGIGNDWGKMYKNPIQYKEAIEMIKNESNVILQDAGYIRFPENESNNRYFINIAGFGFDAVVLKDVLKGKEKGKSGTLIYLTKLLTNLIRSSYYTVDYECDNEKKQAIVFNMTTGICRYNGNGMLQLPFSDPFDGLLDVSIVRKIKKIKVLANVNRLFDGSYVLLKEVELIKCKSIKINSEKALAVEADGEFLGYAPVEISVIPKSLKLIVNNIEFEKHTKINKNVS